MLQIGVQMHGVKLNLSCNYKKLLDHVACLLDGYVYEVWDQPDIDVTTHWMVGPRDDAQSPFPVGKLDGFGKRMFLGEDVLVWPDTHRNKDLQLRFRDEGTHKSFDAAFWYQPKAKKMAKNPAYEEKKFFDLLRYMVFFPIAWTMERRKKWIMIHASAVADERGAVLIAGPGGAGKTTTSVALVGRAGMTMVTENLLFTDGDKVFPVQEPIRLTDESLALLDGNLGGLAPLTVPGGLVHKAMYHCPAAASTEGWKPSAIFLPQFSEQGFMEEIDSQSACEMVAACNTLTLELNDYYWYSAALDLLWPEAGHAAARLDVLRRLCENSTCYSLGIDKAAGVDPVVEAIVTRGSNGVATGGAS